jgi:hypothetical protein
MSGRAVFRRPGSRRPLGTVGTLVSAATGLAPETIRNGRRELAKGVHVIGRIRQPGAGRPDVEETQPGGTEALACWSSR